MWLMKKDFRLFLGWAFYERNVPILIVIVFMWWCVCCVVIMVSMEKPLLCSLAAEEGEEE